MEDLSNTINFLDLADIYKTLSTTIVEYTFFKSTVPFSKTCAEP